MTEVFWANDRSGKSVKFRISGEARTHVCMVKGCASFSHDPRRLCKGHRAKVDKGVELAMDTPPEQKLEITREEKEGKIFWKMDRKGKVCKYTKMPSSYPTKVCAAKNCPSLARGNPVKFCNIHLQLSEKEPQEEDIPPEDFEAPKFPFPIGEIIYENGLKFKYLKDKHKRYICLHEGCTHRATNSDQKLCPKHGGRVKTCQEENCDNRVCQNTEFCIEHGGGHPCLVPNCPNRGIPLAKYYCTHHSDPEFKLRRRKSQLHILHTNFHAMLKSRLRCRLRYALKGISKAASTMELIGCTTEFLKGWLESKFVDGMSWENYGAKEGIKCWHIDHIRPCASFDLTKPQEQAKCFHYTNLQPLWALDNIRKADKWITEENKAKESDSSDASSESNLSTDSNTEEEE